VYLTVTIPSLRTIVTAVEQVDSRGEQVDAMRVLSAGNVIIIICLGLILALQVRVLLLIRALIINVSSQAGQEYARRKDCLALAAGEKKEQ
jgi:hypothetical protein